MTRKEYEDYKARVGEFFSHGLANLSSKGEPYFSWSSCNCCGNTLGGDRYDCDGYNRATKEVEEYDNICTDCVYFVEYGQLDDTTMMEIEDEDSTK